MLSQEEDSVLHAICYTFEHTLRREGKYYFDSGDSSKIAFFYAFGYYY